MIRAALYIEERVRNYSSVNRRFIKAILTIWHPDAILKFTLIRSKFIVKVCPTSEAKFLLSKTNLKTCNM